MTGAALGQQISGYTVRPVTERDVVACNALCTQIHGHHRGGELLDSIHQGTAMLAERAGQIRGYTSLLGFFGHSVGESTEDLKALIAAASEFAGSGFHVPTANTELLNWCLDNGLRMVKAMTIMSLGLYNQPRGGYMPSILSSPPYQYGSLRAHQTAYSPSNSSGLNPACRMMLLMVPTATSRGLGTIAVYVPVWVRLTNLT